MTLHNSFYIVIIKQWRRAKYFYNEGAWPVFWAAIALNFRAQFVWFCPHGALSRHSRPQSKLWGNVAVFPDLSGKCARILLGKWVIMTHFGPITNQLALGTRHWICKLRSPRQSQITWRSFDQSYVTVSQSQRTVESNRSESRHRLVPPEFTLGSRMDDTTLIYHIPKGQPTNITNRLINTELLSLDNWFDH